MATQISQRCWLELWRRNSETDCQCINPWQCKGGKQLQNTVLYTNYRLTLASVFNFQVLTAKLQIAEPGVLTIPLTSCAGPNNPHVKPIKYRVSHSIPSPALKILQRSLNRSTFVVWEMKRNVSVVRVCSAPNCCGTEQRLKKCRVR